MSLQRQSTTLLLVLISLTCCYVICTRVGRKQHEEFYDGIRDAVLWRTGRQKRTSILDRQFNVIDGALGMISPSSARRTVKLVPDDIRYRNLQKKYMSDIPQGGIWHRFVGLPNGYTHGKVPLQRIQTLSERDLHQVHPLEVENEDVLTSRKQVGQYPIPEEKTILSKCIGREDGVYEDGPCKRWYLLCENGKAKKMFCNNGFYWNGDVSRCEPKNDILYCRLKFDCAGVDDGVYVDGCSNVFWFCKDGVASLSKCPKGLYFSAKKLRCDLKEMIPACRGFDLESTIFLESSGKSIRDWKRHEDEVVQSYRKQEVCERRENGKYAITKCYDKFLFCVDGKTLVVTCHSGQLYSPEHQRCVSAGQLSFCADFENSETTTNVGSSCSSLSDGIYELGDCERNFSICLNGVRSNASCSLGLVYNGQTGYCDDEFNVEKCPNYNKNERRWDESVLTHINTGVVRQMTESHRKQNVCRKRENGMYAIAECYEKYLLCINGRGLVVVCQRGQLFSLERQQCLDSEELPWCADSFDPEATTVSGSSTPCSSLPDGVYELGDCERNFLICFNGVGSNASCGPGFIYNGETGLCDDKSKIKKCLKYKRNQLKWDKSNLSHDTEPDCRCKGQKDGLYAVGCTEKFYSCSNGISTGLECPSDLVFNVDSGFCDYPKNVVACGARQSTTNGEVSIEEEGTASNLVSGCSILDDGIYGLSPCGPGYYHCWRGATSFAKCAFGLVFNPSLNRCDFRENVRGCPQYNETLTRVSSPIHGLTVIPVEGGVSKCESLSDGFYVEGCSRIYYGCANGETFYMSCPSGLAFDYRSGTCDNPSNVEACRAASSKEVHSSVSDNTAPSISSCDALPNGPHQLGFCLSSYILCQDGVINLTSCPDPLVFDPDISRCTLRHNVIVCGRVNQSEEHKLDVQCVVRPDGIFSYNCSKDFYICVKGKKYSLACPDSMVYDSEFRRCKDFSEVNSCVHAGSSIAPLLQKPSSNSHETEKSSDEVCSGRPDGNYASGPCSKIFYSCVHMAKILMSCPETLVFDASVNRCEKPENVLQCRSDPFVEDVSEQLISSTITPFCLGKKDGTYPLDLCLRTYMQCYNQKVTVKYCPDNMVYDGSIAACIAELECSREVISPSQPAFSGITNTENVVEDTKRTEAIKHSPKLCHELADGDYSAGCVTDFITCNAGIPIPKKCPSTMVFSNVLRRCVPYEQCSFLMYRVLASLHPSEDVYDNKDWIKYDNITLVESSSVTEFPLSPVNDSVSDANDGRCKYVQVTCLSKPAKDAIRVPDSVAGKGAERCKYVRVQCIGEDSGKLNQISEQLKVTEANTEEKEEEQEEETEGKFCLPELSENQIDSLRCDNMEDGLYALDCSDKVAVCSDGWKKIYRCAQGQLFIPTLRRCDESWKCTGMNRCGSGFVGVIYLGKIKPSKPINPIPEANLFSCAKRGNGNYGKQCSPIYVKCFQNIAILMRCQSGQLFDQRAGHCVPQDHCTILPPSFDPNKVRCIENERLGIGICNDHYYTCSNGKFVLAKCPPRHSFDPVHGTCSSKCDICGCEGDKWTNTPTCKPGEFIPVGLCENKYLECGEQQTFEVRHCVKGKRFDSTLFTCRFRYEIEGCFQNPVRKPGVSVPAVYRIHDSFQSPSQLNAYLRNVVKQYDWDPYKWDLLQAQPIKTALHGYPKVFSPTLHAPLSNIFVPKRTSVQDLSSGFKNFAGQMKIVKDTFRVIPVIDENSPVNNMRNLGMIDHFHLPNNPPTYSASKTTTLSDSLVAPLSDPSRANKNAAVDSLEGSGEAENTSSVTDALTTGRTKRDASFGTEFSEFETGLSKGLEAEVEDDQLFSEIQDLCHAKTDPVNIALGFCRSKYISCNRKKKVASVLKCEGDELFDGRLGKCVSAVDCEQNKLSPNNKRNGSTPCALLLDGTYALPGCSQHFLSCVSNKALLRSCPDDLYYNADRQQCDYKERISNCNGRRSTIHGQFIKATKGDSSVKSTVAEFKVEATNEVHEIPSMLPNFACSIDSTVSLGCSPSFVVCAGGIAYIFSCDSGLLFDQITSSCNTVEETVECNKLYIKQKAVSVNNELELGSFSSLPEFDDLPYSLVNLTNVSSDVSIFDCMSARDGLYASHCSPLFFVCSAGQITGFVCQDTLVFNLETGFCDQKEYVASCREADLNSAPILSSTAKKTLLKPAYQRQKCGRRFNGIISKSCSREFILCVNGVDHMFICQQGLIYNAETDRCDYAENIVACADETRNEAHDLQASGSSDDTVQALCNASRGQAVGNGHCRMDYSLCAIDGTIRELYCTNGYLFDEDIGRCVPAEVCGTVSGTVTGSASLTKGKCDGIEDGASVGIGPCLSQYYVCKKGVPFPRRCFKHLETFSVTAGTCVAPSMNPDCPLKSNELSDRITEVDNTDDFCIQRPDGFYRHPLDCARILQCFGKEMFEYLPCNDGLVFNEISGGCDYKSNVPECAAVSMKSEKGGDISLAGSDCRGKSHGDTLVDKKNCSVYYRCVWGKLEKLFCPENTVFNPVLSVCDFPSEVPYCKAAL